jgi:hypothetical protein
MYYHGPVTDIMNIFGIFVILAFIALWIGLFIFWILMLIDAIKRPMEGYARLPWILLIVFFNPFGALIYYFIVKLPADKLAAATKTPSVSTSAPVAVTPAASTQPVVAHSETTHTHTETDKTVTEQK